MNRIIKWTKQFADEFKVFALRGNVLDLAIGVIIGAGFNKIVTSVVQDLLMPFLGLFFLGAFDLSTLQFSVGNTTFSYGHFLQTMLDFILIAFGIFLIIKAVNIFIKEEEKSAIPDKNTLLLNEMRKQVSLLETISQQLKK